MLNGQNKQQQFYDHYFDTANYDVFRYDVGSFCTRNFIIKNMQNTTGRLLEIGTGISTLLEDLPLFERHGIDISPKNIEIVTAIFQQKNISVNLKVADAEDLPYEANFFDAIVSSHTLEHVEHDDAVIRECARVLKSKGEAIFFVPGRITGIATIDEWEKFGHYRLYNSERFKQLASLVAPEMQLTTMLYPHKIHNLIWNNLKNFFRWSNYPIKKWVYRDHKTYELRPMYQKVFMPATATVLDYLDTDIMKRESNFLGNEFNMLVRFEKK
jgi:ubiquinone/menaquinone biosynthesis C-methylase UbiE